MHENTQNLRFQEDFVRLKVQTGQSGRQPVIVQIVLCEVAVACKDTTNRRIDYEKVVSRTANIRVRRIVNKYGLQIML